MAAAVENSKAVCFFLSKDYQDSRACKKELQYADELEKPLIPCRLLRDWKPSGWLGLINTGLKWYDFRDFDDNTKKQKIQSSTEELIRFIQVAFFSSKDEIDSINSHRLVKDHPTTSASLRNSLHERLHDQSSGRNERQRSSTVIRNPVSHLEWYDGPSRDVLDALPFAKYAQFPLLSLEEAIKSLDPFIPDIQNRALIAKQHANLYPNKRVLTKDEAAAIILYTMGEGEENLCRYLNRVCVFICCAYNQMRVT
ncbi:unnamed protein product [Rotaria sp. Silwood2]|nr:unnamed protein product [Rotaria sp. Silwood2]CAF4401762.1 unnamed protein product [Rotaria sp. Silwood2]CAF4441074.1 unnamed protein product [Rotaria sp. Silwood2]